MLIFISCLLRYSGKLIFSHFSYFTSWKNGKYFAVAVRQPHCTLKDAKEKTQQSPSTPPFTSRMNVEHLTARLPPAAQKSRPLPLTTAAECPCVLPIWGWLCCISDTKTSPRSQEQTAYPSPAAADDR